MKRSTKTYIEDAKSFLNNKFYVLGFLLLSLIAFAFSAANLTLSIDGLEGDRYSGEGHAMLAAGRFGIWFWSTLRGPWKTPFVADLLALLLLFTSLINLFILFRRASYGSLNTDALLVFGFMVLTYPLIIEIWEYTGAACNIYGSYLLASFALLLIRHQIYGGSWRRPWPLIPAAIMLMLVCAGYEAVVAVYIFLVCAVLALQVIYGSEKEKKLVEVIRQAAVYASMLAVGLVLRVLVHKLTLAILGITAATNGATQIFWGTAPAKDIVLHLFTRWGLYYVINAIKYLPILILDICGLFFLIGWIVGCKKHGVGLLLPGLGMLVSLVIISLVQGLASPYRTCLVFGVFCAFVAMMIVQMLPKRSDKKGWVRIAALVLLGCLFFSQANYIGYFLELNHRRSEEERFVVQQVGLDLERMEKPEKPVIFVGNYTISSGIIEAASIPEDSDAWKLYERVCAKTCELAGLNPENLSEGRKIPETLLNSVLRWSLTAFGGQESMQKLFRYYGFEYVPADYDAVYEEAAAYARQTKMPGYPSAGYIEDVGEYVIVNLRN